MREGTNMDEHLAVQRAETAHWLMSPDGGSLSKAAVCVRLGVTLSALEKILERQVKRAG